MGYPTSGGIAAYLPMATLRTTKHLGGPLWLGDGMAVATSALTATAAVDRLTPAEVGALVLSRVQAGRILAKIIDVIAHADSAPNLAVSVTW